MVLARHRSLITVTLAVTAALILVVAAALTTGIDQQTSDLFFEPSTGHWLIDHDTSGLRLWFYDGPKLSLMLFGLVLLSVMLRPSLAPAGWMTRREAMFLVACLVIVPLAIAGIRNHSNVHCPVTLQRYGGMETDDTGLMRLSEFLEPRQKGRCWPSGHASGGFALLCLAWLKRRRVTQLWFLVPGIVAGISMGIYQVARGAHFASHVLVTGLISILLIHMVASVSGFGQAKATVEMPSHR